MLENYKGSMLIKSEANTALRGKANVLDNQTSIQRLTANLKIIFAEDKYIVYHLY